jgi:hypothetical protein
MSVLSHIQPKIYSLTGGMFANWMPSDRVDVGDYGSIHKERFLRDGSLRDLGLQFAFEETRKAAAKLEYVDGAKFKIGAAVSGATTQALGIKAKAGVSMQFSGVGAFVYHLSGINQRRFKNPAKFYELLGKEMLAERVTFDDDAVLVDEVRLADTSTIIVSESKDGKLDLTTGFNPIGAAFLANAKGNIQVTQSAGSFFRWIADGSTIPLIHLVRPYFPGGPGGGPSAGSLSKFVRYLRTLVGGRRLEIPEIHLKKYVEQGRRLHYSIKSLREVVQMEFRDITVEELLGNEAQRSRPKSFVTENVSVVAARPRRLLRR